MVTVYSMGYSGSGQARPNDDDGNNNETLEKNRDRGGCSRLVSDHRRRYRPPKRQECSNGAKWQSAAPGLVGGSERIGRNQA